MRMPVSIRTHAAAAHLTLRSPKGILGSTRKIWAHSNIIPVALGKEWGNTSMDTRQTGGKTQPASLNSSPSSRVHVADWEIHTCLLPGGRHLGTAVGQALSFPHFVGMFASRQECKARTGPALLNHRSLTVIKSGPEPRGNLHWWKIQFPTTSPTFPECTRESDCHQTPYPCTHLWVACGSPDA